MVKGEPRFFSHDERYAEGVGAYHAQFADRGAARLAGEGSNAYANCAMFPHSAERIARYNPDIKMIYMVRHPLERIVSSWIQLRSDRGDDIPATLDRAVAEIWDALVDESHYWKNLQRHRAHIPDERIFIGFMEDLQADRLTLLRDLASFLEIAPPEEVRRGHENVSSQKRVPSKLYSAVNRIPGIDAAKSLLPAGLKTQVKTRVLSRSAKERPTFSAETRARLVETLRPDADAFLAHTGRPTEFWAF